MGVSSFKSVISGLIVFSFSLIIVPVARTLIAGSTNSFSPIKWHLNLCLIPNSSFSTIAGCSCPIINVFFVSTFLWP